MTLSAVMCLHFQDDILWLRSFEQSEAKSGAETEAEGEAPPKDRYCWAAHVDVGVAPGRPGTGKATGEVSAWTFMTQYDDVSAGFLTVSVAWVERTSWLSMS